MALHGTNAVFALDNSSGASQNLTSSVKSVSPELMQAIHEITTLGNSAVTKTVGLKDGKASITFIADSTIVDHLTGLFAAQTPGSSTTWTLTIGPRGSTTGYQKLTAEVFLTSLPIPIEVNNIIEITAQFEVSGGWTIGTY